MKKIKLDPEHLRIDTFAVTPDRRGRDGTVRAHSPGFTFQWCCSTAEPICRTNEGCYTEGPCFTENHTVCDCDQAPSEVEDC